MDKKQAFAITKYVRISPSKARLAAGLIRRKSVEEALLQLDYCNLKGGRLLKKTLKSAIANAENNHDLDVDNLVVAEAYVGKNLVMKRFRPRAKGRAARIIKPFSQLTIIVREMEETQAGGEA